MNYDEAKAKWDGDTSRKSFWFNARDLGCSHEEAVIYAVTNKLPQHAKEEIEYRLSLAGGEL